MSAPDVADAGAAAALADLFFTAPSESSKTLVNDVRRRYRDWRSSGEKSSAIADVLDLNHDLKTQQQRSSAAGLRRVKTYAGSLHGMPPVRHRTCTHRLLQDP